MLSGQRHAQAPTAVLHGLELDRLFREELPQERGRGPYRRRSGGAGGLRRHLRSAVQPHPSKLYPSMVPDESGASKAFLRRCPYLTIVPSACQE